ncbi:thioredoxin family protein [Aquifex sp.]
MMLRIFLGLLLLLQIGLSQEWFTDFTKGVEIAKKKNKLVLIYFYSEHCPYCYHVEEFIFGDRDVENLLKKHFVVITINYEQDEEYVEKFGIFGTPTFVILDPKTGKVLKKIFGSVPKEKFLSLLTSACNKSSVRRC